MVLIIMIVAVLLFAYYVILGRDLPEGLNIPQVMVTNSAGEGSPDSGEKMKPEKSSLRVDSSVRKQTEPVVKGLDTKEITGKADKMEKRNRELNEESVKKSKKISRTFEVLKQSNLVIEEILLQKR
ncbi:MAG: hypothetical protein H8E10_10380 [Desulfobacterales bacterium]|nr:hypothetical protein [Desulfobacterales bacterium]MBL7205273.1 hypothetical protein [Desulfobacteraceae bacterium]